MSESELERIRFAFHEIKHLTEYYIKVQNVMHHFALKTEILTRIYTIASSFYLRFITYPSAYNSKIGIANSKLWYVMYKKSFNHLKAIMKVESAESEAFQLSSMSYRKIYEKQREKDWSTAHWKRYLPLEILNMISEYLY